MNRPEKIDFFELSDKILERLNTEGNVNLSHYDINLKLRRDVIIRLTTSIYIYLFLMKSIVRHNPEILSDLVIFIDEQFPYDQLDKNGFPFFQLNFRSSLNNFDFRIPIDFNASDFNNKIEIIQKLENKINGA